MEKNINTNVMPEIAVIPGGKQLDRLASVLIRLLSYCPLNAPDYMSNHYTHPLDTEPTYDAQQSLWD